MVVLNIELFQDVLSIFVDLYSWL